MSRIVVVRCCKCGAAGRVESSKEISPQLKQLYCSCGNPECGHTWVMNLEFAHTLSPSALDLPEAMRQKIRTLSPAQQGRLFM
ncbi:MAG: ogr/Delta-like zinc finger family protein [Desulfovibrio sp.]|uniref:ogr/Delta-like zinc finger family protein n=1 Tax=Desulfovibrio sp. 7SRBS1 TaxID=3378064 RepID=UPI003B42551D